MSSGLRDRKKQQTREAIARVALSLFEDRGFDAVTVAEVAAAADVAQATVFNYFPRKEDLLYWRFADFGDALLAAVRDRGRGTSILRAFEEFIVETAAAGAADLDRRVSTTARIITDSEALLAREREILATYADKLAALIAGEVKARENDLRPRVAAGALSAVHRALIAFARERALAGRAGPALATDLRREGRRAFALLEPSLGNYAVKR